MTRKGAARIAHQENALCNLGFTLAEAAALRRISMTLQRWHEAECNGDVQRNEDTGQTYRQYGGGAAPLQTVKCADRETGARKRLAAILKARNERVETGSGTRFTANFIEPYIQTDPRGAALYIIRPGDVPEGSKVDSCYSRGICVY